MLGRCPPVVWLESDLSLEISLGVGFQKLFIFLDLFKGDILLLAIVNRHQTTLRENIF